MFLKKNISKKANIILLGASVAGKTTLVRYLETGQPVFDNPRTTLGIDIRQKPMKIADWELSAIDVDGQDLYRESLWALGVSQSDVIIYVIDGTVKPSSDSDTFEISRFSFDYMLSIVDSKNLC
ncbi:MAG: 50S ribosome-binding GTPase [Candidatus Heimdallarchaeum endolithica]|uniref:50S ribosome-binding GTPase n=1 Tax=Candidatus Heimdallarchaeum endolithica TaxID=2876572 RepID=A0A9Y1BTM7_9ARCH|nr:MAG: 50S ribosome-binding GTPase [Candidatus Heimdallarchaeum endolithica]